MLIRKSTPADAEAVGDVDVQAFRNSGWGQAHEMGRDEDLQRKRREESCEFCRAHPDWVYVGVEDDRIVGFTAFEFDEATAPEYRNRGVSTELVRSAVEELIRLGAKRIHLRTIHVPAALRVYEKAGFRVEKTVHETDSEGGPAATMYYYEMFVDSPGPGEQTA